MRPALADTGNQLSILKRDVDDARLGGEHGGKIWQVDDATIEQREQIKRITTEGNGCNRLAGRIDQREIAYEIGRDPGQFGTSVLAEQLIEKGALLGNQCLLCR